MEIVYDPIADTVELVTWTLVPETARVMVDGTDVVLSLSLNEYVKVASVQIVGEV